MGQFFAWTVAPRAVRIVLSNSSGLKSAAVTRLLLDRGADVVFADGASAVRLIAMILVAQMSSGSRADGQANQIQTEPTRTAKERLSSKAGEQRVDNCKVPPGLHGPKPRHECDDGVSTRHHK